MNKNKKLVKKMSEILLALEGGVNEKDYVDREMYDVDDFDLEDLEGEGEVEEEQTV
jgi:hypothetical protein